MQSMIFKWVGSIVLNDFQPPLGTNKAFEASFSFSLWCSIPVGAHQKTIVNTCELKVLHKYPSYFFRKWVWSYNASNNSTRQQQWNCYRYCKFFTYLFKLLSYDQFNFIVLTFPFQLSHVIENYHQNSSFNTITYDYNYNSNSNLPLQLQFKFTITD